MIKEKQVSNHPQAISKLVDGLIFLDMTNECFLICAEHTGRYTYMLICACKSVGCKLWIENPTQIKYSLGMNRGNNDKVDAKCIDIYASRFCDKAIFYKRPIEELTRLTQL